MRDRWVIVGPDFHPVYSSPLKPPPDFRCPSGAFISAPGQGFRPLGGNHLAGGGAAVPVIVRRRQRDNVGARLRVLVNWAR